MRIVALADTHLFTDDYKPDDAGRVLPDGDVLLHVGDALRGGSLRELTRFAVFFRAQPHRIKIFVPGNHDGIFESDPESARMLLGSDVITLIDESVTIEGVRFFGSPWTPTFFDWAFMKDPGPALALCMARIPDVVDVLASHGPPKGILDGEASHPLGSEDLLNRVRDVKPLLHVFGHIHGARGVVVDGPTTFANVTTAECDHPPMVFDVDIEKRTVTILE
jgi:Icc-related predicted phosphoesterase